MSDETEIRGLIERWAAAVHAGDLATVLDRHDDGIVMFDVPPPERGLRGLGAYRDAWPPFFGWQAAGACFELDELDVTAGADVAFAVALLRCGTPEELAAAPGRRLRLTIGLRKGDGGWVVTHEHHSFTHDEPPAGEAEAEVRAIQSGWTAQTAARDLDGLMAHVAPGIVSYEQAGELEYVGIDAVREVCREGLGYAEAPAEFTTPELAVRVGGDLVVTWGLDHIEADGQTIDSRGTRIFERRGGRWLMIHQHVSLPAAG